MTERFYPYFPTPSQPNRCEHPECVYLALWWDAVHDAIWCDLHARLDSSAPVRVQCETCGEMYPPASVKQGVCVDCRSVMPLLWVDDEVTQ